MSACVLSLYRGSGRGLYSALAALLVTAICVASAHAAPVIGTFKSDDMDGGVFLTGRWTEGFTGPLPGDPNGVGNGAHAGSWDGATLYTHWELAGPTLASYVVTDNRDGSGTGTVVYERVFDPSAATVTLQPTAWWTGGGDGVYTVNLDHYFQTMTAMYVTNNLAFVGSTESFHGTFAGHPGYELVGQGSGALVSAGLGAPPAGYPSWIPNTAVSGAWGDAGLIEFTIAPEPATLALVGIGLAAVVMRRRR